ncbi:hypothetical protein ABBQ38_008458 [Trebouxia sp. C0009 RCD-2024]
MTFADVNHRANQLARHLCTLGVATDIPVAVLMERSFDLIIAMMGVLKAGGAILPMDPNYPEQRLAYMVTNAAAIVLLTHHGLQDRLPHSNTFTQVVDVDEYRQVLSDHAVTNLDLPCSSSDMMYLIYTSGSTGNPKGVMEDHVSLVNLIDWSMDKWRLSSQSSVLLKTAVSFDPSVFEIFAPLALGGRLIIAKPDGHEDYDYMKDLITQERVTWVIMVPTVLPFFLDACEVDSSACSTLTHLCCSGEAYPKSLGKRACVLLPHTKIINFYGPTEATIGVSHWLVNEGNCEGVSTLPIGGPIANTHFYVLDANLQQVPVGKTGELYISGIMLARGYMAQPGLTADRFLPNPFSRGDKQHARMYKTGDEAFWRSDGVVVFIGRVQKDQQVKLRGIRIELTEVEHHLSSFAGVKQAVAVVHVDSIQQQHLVGYLSPRNLDIEQLRQHVGKFLPKQMIPDSFVFLDKLPNMPNGKADRAALPEPKYLEDAMADYIAPIDGMQEAGLLSNAMVSKLLLKYMQGKAGLKTKMVLPRSGMKMKVQEMHSMGQQHLADMLKKAASRPFDLATGPMIRATLISMSQQDDTMMSEEHTLIISTHYSVADGWSMGVLFRDLSRAYNMLKLGQEPVMPELPIGFMEHAQRQHSHVHAKQSADLEWWCEKLQGASVKPLLATDYARSGRANVGQRPGNIIAVKLSGDMVCRLRILAQLNGSSLFVTVLAAFKVLLAKYSSRDDLVVGTPSSGRHRPELQGNTIGCFVNLTALRTSLAGPLTFSEVIRRVHNTVAEGLAHADVPQMQVIAELARRQKLWPFDAVPYQVLFALHDAALLSGMQLAGVTTKAIEPIHTGSCKVDIFLELYEASDGAVAGHIEYDSSLWKHSSINAMAADLLATLEELIRCPNSNVDFQPITFGSRSRGSAWV